MDRSDNKDLKSVFERYGKLWGNPLETHIGAEGTVYTRVPCTKPTTKFY